MSEESNRVHRACRFALPRLASILGPSWLCGRRLGGLLRHCASGDPKRSGVCHWTFWNLLLCSLCTRHRSCPSAFSDAWIPMFLPHVKPPADSLSIVSSAHLLAGDPSRPPTGRIPRSISRLGSFVGLSSLLAAGSLGRLEAPQSADSPTAPPLPPFHGGHIRKSTKQQRLQSSSVHGLKAHPPLRCHAKIAIVNTRLLWLFIGSSSEFLIQ